MKVKTKVDKDKSPFSPRSITITFNTRKELEIFTEIISDAPFKTNTRMRLIDSIYTKLMSLGWSLWP